MKERVNEYELRVGENPEQNRRILVGQMSVQATVAGLSSMASEGERG